MGESIRTLRKRIETLERKRLAARERPPNRTMWDLSILSDEELHLLERITTQCNGAVGPKTDLSVLSQEDRDGLILISKKFEPDCFEA